MRFFNQKEKNYLREFVNQHRNIRQTYVRPFTLMTLADFIEEGVYRNSYFFMRGMVALFNAGVSCCKGISALLTFSFKDAKLAALNTGHYLASWVIKHGFFMLSTCLNIAQLLTKAVATYVNIFNVDFWVEMIKRKHQRFMSELDSLSAYRKEIHIEIKSILKMSSQYYKQLDAYNEEYITCFSNSSQQQDALRMFLGLKKMHQNLIDGLVNYPDCLLKPKSTVNDIIFVHRELQEHHANVSELAVTFFKEFDAYLRLKDSAKCLKEDQVLALSH